MSHSHHDPMLDVLYSVPTRQESFIKRYGLKIAGSIACSGFVAFVMHLGAVKTVILWGCQIVLIVFGRPHGSEKVQTAKHEMTQFIADGKQVLKGSHGVPLVLPVVGPVREALAVKKTVEDVKDKVDSARDVAKEGVKKVEKVGETVVGALKDAGNSTVAAVGGGVTAASALFNARAEKKEKEQREKLEAHAALIGLKTDPDWTLPRLQGEVIQAELKWQAIHGPNAQCPNPKCRHGMRIKTKRAETLRCARCGLLFPSRRAIALGPPNVPRNIHLFNK